MDWNDIRDILFKYLVEKREDGKELYILPVQGFTHFLFLINTAMMNDSKILCTYYYEPQTNSFTLILSRSL